MIIEDYVSFETAKLLKEKGFKEITQGYITADEEIYMLNFQEGVYELGKNKYPYPTLQMAMKWLREVHNIHIDIDPDWASKGGFAVIGYCFNIHSIVNPWYEDLVTYPTYEQAAEAAIKYCLENLI